MTRGGRGVKKLEIWGDVIYGWSLILISFIFICRKTWPAQVVYLISIGHLIKIFVNRNTKKLPKAVLPILAVITPAHNLILLPIHLILERIISVGLEPRAFMSVYYFFGWSLFFQMVRYRIKYYFLFCFVFVGLQ